LLDFQIPKTESVKVPIRPAFFQRLSSHDDAAGSRYLCPRDETDQLYWNVPYYIASEGEVGRQAFAAIREAIKKEGMVARS